MKMYVKISSLMLLLYVIQFVLFPRITPQYYPKSNEASAIFVISCGTILALGTLAINAKIKHWIPADLIYIMLVLLYSGHGAYGFGMSGITLDGLQSTYSNLTVFDVIPIFVSIIGLQLILKGGIWIISIVLNKLKKV